MKNRNLYIFLLPHILAMVYISYLARNFVIFTLPALSRFYKYYGNEKLVLKDLIFHELTRGLAYQYILYWLLGLISIALLFVFVERQKSQKFTLIFISIMLTILIYGAINVSYKSAYVLRDLIAKSTEEGDYRSQERMRKVITVCADPACLESENQKYLESGGNNSN